MPAMSIFAAPVWHWWISVFLTIGGVGMVLSLIVGYVVKVVKPRYEPKKR
jgi:formate-dependent nitrite reductase membrane component NrfD